MASTQRGGLAGYQRTDQHYATSEARAKQRLKAIYANAPETTPSNEKLTAMARNVMRHGYKYFDTVRENKSRYSSTPTNTPVGGGSGGTAPGRGRPSGGSSSGGLANYQRTDQHYAQSETLARQRINAIYSNYHDKPSDEKIAAMARNAVARGYGYFDTIRNNMERYLTPISGGVEDNKTDPDEGINDEDGDGIDDELQIDYEAQARAMYPWLPTELLNEFIGHWTELENEQAAWGKVRQSPRYDFHFPGIKREDGSLRMSEQEYLGEIDGYEQAFESFGIPKDAFREKFHKFIENGQSADQVRRRLATRYTEVASMSEEIRSFYAENFGAGGISMAAILASSLDPGLNPLVAEEQFRISHVGGTGREFGFDLAMEEAERLADFGMNRQAAQGFFGQAKAMLPTMRELAERHNDPDDEFDITDAADALIFQDPEEIRRVKRLFAAESASFTGQGGVVRMGQDGGLTGLRPR